jgi:hypothetical protein
MVMMVLANITRDIEHLVFSEHAIEIAVARIVILR